jgi:hypothetical protein
MKEELHSSEYRSNQRNAQAPLKQATSNIGSSKSSSYFGQQRPPKLTSEELA